MSRFCPCLRTFGSLRKREKRLIESINEIGRSDEAGQRVVDFRAGEKQEISIENICG